MKIKFKPLTPVFIGSGESYYPMDYFIDDKIYFIDNAKFNRKIIEKNLFDEFIKASENIDDLLDFIDENANLDDAYYGVEADNNILEKLLETNSRGIEAFIKDKFLFTPYIPGSTLKGVIRTALLDYFVRKHNLRGSIKELESKVFCGNSRFDAKEDNLKALFIEDLKPVNFKLKVINPLNYPYKKRKVNKIPVLLECLIDGEFEGEIRIESRLFALNNYFDEELNINLIKKSLNNFFANIFAIENKRFRLKPPPFESGNIKIGKHSGAGSKSIRGRKIEIKQIRKTFDYQLSVWGYGNRPMGWGKIIF